MKQTMVAVKKWKSVLLHLSWCVGCSNEIHNFCVISCTRKSKYFAFFFSSKSSHLWLTAEPMTPSVSVTVLPLCRLLCQQVCCSGFCRVSWSGATGNWKRWRQDHYCVPVLHQHRHVWWLSNKVSADLCSPFSRDQMSGAARIDKASTPGVPLPQDTKPGLNQALEHWIGLISAPLRTVGACCLACKCWFNFTLTNSADPILLMDTTMQHF